MQGSQFCLQFREHMRALDHSGSCTTAVEYLSETGVFSLDLLLFVHRGPFLPPTVQRRPVFGFVRWVVRELLSTWQFRGTSAQEHGIAGWPSIAHADDEFGTFDTRV